MAAKGEFIVNKKKYQLVPPDGGWGYMICIAATINFSVATMFGGCFGLIYKDFLIHIDMNSTSVNLFVGVNAMSVALAGYFTSDLFKIMSVRKCALLGGLLINVGMFATVFSYSKFLFFVFQGAFVGAGTGLTFNITSTIINDYFVKKRLLAISIAQTMSGVAALVAPQFVKLMLEEYGYRGTLILISGITLQIFVAIALMQPAKWHMVKVEVPEGNTEEIKLLLEGEKANNIVLTTPVITLTDTENCKEIDIIKLKGKETSSFMKIINELLDPRLLKKFCLSCASMGPTFCMFAEMLFMFMLPLALYDMQWDQYNVAKAIMLGCLGDLVTRTSFIFLNKWVVKLGSQEAFLIGLLIAIVSRLCMLWVEKPTLVLLFITLIGVARSSIMVLPVLILSDVFKPEEFTKAMGIMMLLFGVMNLVLGPAIGAVRDMTNSYPTAFYIITTSLTVVVLLWSVELIYKRNKHKRKLQLLAAEEPKRKRSKNRGK